jgi:hypothetical protein
MKKMTHSWLNHDKAKCIALFFLIQDFVFEQLKFYIKKCIKKRCCI